VLFWLIDQKIGPIIDDKNHTQTQAAWLWFAVMILNTLLGE